MEANLELIGRAQNGDESMIRDLIGNQAGPVMKDQAEVPRLTESQTRQALTVIAANYGMFKCYK